MSTSTHAGSDGAHRIVPSQFRDTVSHAPAARFRPERGRYHLYVVFGCPWAQRTLIGRALKGLEDAIGVTALHHELKEGEGWTFAPERPDPLYGATHLSQLYQRAAPGYAGRITVPVLWDQVHETIVNNESSEILRLFGQAFDVHARHPGVDLYPLPLRTEIERWNALVQRDVNEGVYGAGFATTQQAHGQAVLRLFAALDLIDQHLAEHPYLVGQRPTEADWRLFPTLLRFDAVYHGLFKCNLKRLVDYPNLWSYARALYQWPGIVSTVDHEAIRLGYWGSMRKLNPNGIVPLGPLPDWTAPHGRG
jgi:glutathionyl-hydroquinone reductase